MAEIKSLPPRNILGSSNGKIQFGNTGIIIEKYNNNNNNNNNNNSNNNNNKNKDNNEICCLCLFCVKFTCKLGLLLIKTHVNFNLMFD